MSWTRKIWGNGILKFAGIVNPADVEAAVAMPLTGIAGDDGKEVFGASGDAAYAGADIVADKPTLMGLVAGIFGRLAGVLTVQAQAPSSVTAAIGDGAWLSASIALDGKLPCGFYIPASFEGGYIEFQRSLTGVDGEFYDVVDDYSGSRIRLIAPSSSFVRLSNPAEWIGVRFMKIRSVTSAGVATAQTGAASIIVPLQG